ncbi:hypothetical protein GCM10009119_02280 [Algoriphagus jejuensis]|uniref:Uncharacterized protein n=1 Tax=Algoriphagus jejuensis TaxID=419934 RepID=A0ABP3Y940_9BACT
MFPRTIKITLEKTETGFSAYANDFPVFVTGGTIPELIDHAVESTSFYFKEENISIFADIKLKQTFGNSFHTTDC